MSSSVCPRSASQRCYRAAAAAEAARRVLPSAAMSAPAKRDAHNLTVETFYASVLSYGSARPGAYLQVGSWGGVTLEDNGVEWQWDHIFPLRTLTSTTSRRRGLSITKEQMMPVTSEDNAKKSI